MDRYNHPKSVGDKPELEPGARSAGEQTTHETSAPPLGTVLPVKMLLRLGLIVTMFNKIHLFLPLIKYTFLQSFKKSLEKAHVHQSYHLFTSQTKVLTLYY